MTYNMNNELQFWRNNIDALCKKHGISRGEVLKNSPFRITLFQFYIYNRKRQIKHYIGSYEIKQNESTTDFCKRVYRSLYNKIYGVMAEQVVLVETGQVFCSIEECSKHLQIPEKEIADAITTGKEIKNVHFKYV